MDHVYISYLLDVVGIKLAGTRLYAIIIMCIQQLTAYR